MRLGEMPDEDRRHADAGTAPAGNRRMWQALGRQDPVDRRAPSTEPAARRSTPSPAATSRAAGPTGRKDSSSARRSCSSTPPATNGFSISGSPASLSDMPAHVTHFGVHDHGFNQVSTYGNLLRLMARGAHRRTNEWQKEYFELALKCSAAVQARRWTDLGDGCRLHPLLQRPAFAVHRHHAHAACAGARPPARPCDEGRRRRRHPAARPACRARTHHGDTTACSGAKVATSGTSAAAPPTRRSSTSTNGAFRCVGTQQGYSGYSTWMRGLAWAMTGYAELLEFLDTLDEAALAPYGGKAEIVDLFDRAAAATCDFYIAHTATDGIPYWDTGAPGLTELGDVYARAVGAGERHRAGRQLGGRDRRPGAASAMARWLADQGRDGAPAYTQAGLTVLATLLGPAYLCARSRPSGAGAAQPVSPAQRLGLRPAGPARTRPARRPCGATITCANWPSWFSGWRRPAPIRRSSPSRERYGP